MHWAVIILAMGGLFEVSSLVHEVLRVLLDLLIEAPLVLTLERAAHLVVLAGHVTRPRLR